MLSDHSGSPRIGYVLKMYPRLSETFVVSEILAREAAGENLVIFSLRPPVDSRFHAELARVAAPVVYIDRPWKTSLLWAEFQSTAKTGVGSAMSACLDELLLADVDDAVQAVILARAVREYGITHLHAHFASVATTVARLASLLTGVPYSFTAHAKDLFHESVDPADLAVKLAGAHHAVTVSEYNFDYLRRRFPAETLRLHRVYNGLELARFPFTEHRPPSGPLAVVAVGRLVEKKGFSLLVDAAHALHHSGVALTVDIVGGGELTGALSEQIHRLGLFGTVRLLGPVSQTEVALRLAAADLFVAPCIVGSDGNADGLPTSILEAMALGVPCISTDVTGIPEIVRAGETGILCRSGSLDDLVAAMRGAADPAANLGRLARNARRVVEESFDSARQARVLGELCAHTDSDASHPTNQPASLEPMAVA
ncbi:glycosyltransferase family 4 protein [Cryobacterium sp. M15]|uniref:glycosyltransferase family 4 protein n=1 Tax=Cryobacterium sp. M15 TaxID=2048291 RepID=UPI000CE2E894|nr:glycosyltransferase family 4 protein [Cryobacterium sp. M15]